MAPRPRLVALLAASAAAGFAAAVVLGDEARGDLLPSLSTPTLPTLPTLTTPTLPALPPPPPIPPPPPLPPVPPAPGLPQPPGLPGGAGASGSSSGSSASGGSASAPGGSGSAAAGSARTRSGRVQASRRRFATRGRHRGTTITFHLSAPAMVVFTVHGPSPSCGVAGTKAVRGHAGLNRIRLTGRFDGRPLQPGTYRIDVIVRRGKSAKRIGRLSVQVVPSRSRLRRSNASPPAFHCVYSPPLPAFPSAAGGAGGGGVLGVVSTRRGGHPAGNSSPHRSSVFAVPPMHLGGAAGSLWRTVLDLLAYGILAVSGGASLFYVARFVKHTTRSP